MIEKKFIPYAPEQQQLLPVNLHDWLPDNHIAYFIMDVVNELDLNPIYNKYASTGGRPPYDPRMLVSLLIYGYCSGVTSSRKLEKACYESVAFRIISTDQKPDHDTIASFRNKNLKSLAGFFTQTLELCHSSGLLKLGNIAIDGSKFRANASKHKAMSYDRMAKKISEMEKEMKELILESKRVDKQEDAKYGKGKRIGEIPKELADRKTRIQKLREAKKRIEEEAIKRAQEEAQCDDDSDDDVSKGQGGTPEPTKKAAAILPKPKAQINFTDPDSKIMIDGATKSFAQCYNTQIAVDSKSQIIVSTNLTNQANDKRQIIPVIEKLTTLFPNVAGANIIADAGYYSQENVEYLEESFQPYIATGRRKHSEKSEKSLKGRLKNDATVKEKMVRKLKTKLGKKIYRRRKAIVEPVYAHIKQCQGIRQFRFRGKAKVSYEWDFICATHNLLKLFRFGMIG